MASRNLNLILASPEDRVLEGDNCSLCSDDLGLLDSDSERVDMAGKKAKPKRENSSLTPPPNSLEEKTGGEPSKPSSLHGGGTRARGGGSTVLTGKGGGAAEGDGGVATNKQDKQKKLTRTEAKRLMEARTANEVAHEALPLTRKTEPRGTGKAAASLLKRQLKEKDKELEETGESAAALDINGLGSGSTPQDHIPTQKSNSVISNPPSVGGDPVSEENEEMPHDNSPDDASSAIDWTLPYDRPATYEELLSFVKSASNSLAGTQENATQDVQDVNDSPPSKKSMSKKIDKYVEFPFTAYIHGGEERGPLSKDEFQTITDYLDKEYARLLELGQEPELETDGNGYEGEKAGRPGRGFVTCLTQASFNCLAARVQEVEIGDRHFRAWPWLPRPPRISSTYPWLASLFVPPFFPFTESTFLQSLASKHGLDGEAGELIVTEKSTRGGRDGFFYRFGIDNVMRESLKAKQFILRYAIHRTTIFVSANRNYPGNENLTQSDQSSQPNSSSQGNYSGSSMSETAHSVTDKALAKKLKNARKRQRAAENRRNRQAGGVEGGPVSHQTNSHAGMASNTGADVVSCDTIPDKCIEPEIFWAMPRPERLAYRKKVKTLLGRIPVQYVCPTEDDCLTMEAAKRLRTAGDPPGLVITYPEAVPGSVFRKNQEIAKAQAKMCE